jgi:hypothetical protein
LQQARDILKISFGQQLLNAQYHAANFMSGYHFV